MPSATNLRIIFLCLRSVESHRSGELQLKFAWEVLSAIRRTPGSMEADFVLEKTPTGPILIASDGSMTA
jgi:hypothetical protein